MSKQEQANQPCPKCNHTPSLSVTCEEFNDLLEQPSWEATGEYWECPKCGETWDWVDYRHVAVEL